MLGRVAVLALGFLVITLDAIPVEVYQRNIPVEVRYEGDVVKVIPREVQARRNLDAKVQLDAEELSQALKHLPIPVEPEVLEEAKQEEKLQLSTEEEVPTIKEFVSQELQDNLEKPQEHIAEQLAEVPKEQILAVKSLIQPETEVIDETIQGKAVLKPSQVPSAVDKLLQESHDIIKTGLKNLKDSFRPGKGELSPSSEQWATLDEAVDNYFEEEKEKLLIRQAQPAGTDTGSPVAPAPSQNNWMQNIVNGFNGIAANFVQSIQNLGGPNNGSPGSQEQGDEGTGQQPPNQGFQGFVQFFNNGVSNIVSSITGNNGPTTSNNNLSDEGAPGPSQPSGPIGFFGTIVSNVQNALGIQQPAAGGQSDTGSPVQQQQNGPVQVIQSVGNAITSFFNGNQNRPPGASADEGLPSPAQPSNTNIIQNIQNAIQNSPLNPFRPQGGSSNQNPVQNAIQSVGTQAQQLIPASGQSPDGAKKPVDSEQKPISEAQPEAEPEPEKPIKDNEILKKEKKTVPSA